MLRIKLWLATCNANSLPSLLSFWPHVFSSVLKLDSHMNSDFGGCGPTRRTGWREAHLESSCLTNGLPKGRALGSMIASAHEHSRLRREPSIHAGVQRPHQTESKYIYLNKNHFQGKLLCVLGSLERKCTGRYFAPCPFKQTHKTVCSYPETNINTGEWERI